MIFLLCVALTEVTHGYLSGIQHGWMVGRPGLVVLPFPCTLRASADGPCAGVGGLLTWQPRTPTVRILGEEAAADGWVQRYSCCVLWSKNPQGTPSCRERGHIV